MTVLLLGVIMAGVVIYGSKRQEDVSILVAKLDAAQVSAEVMAGVANRLQAMYATESSCDPDVLHARLNAMATLPTSASSLNASGVTSGVTAYAAASPGDSSQSAREGRCTAATGCRQFAVPLENRAYIVTVGAVIAGLDRDGDLNRVTEGAVPDRDCPRDAIVRLHMSLNGTSFSQRVSLINNCTMISCTTCTGSNCDHPRDNFNYSADARNGTSWLATVACPPLPTRYYGSVVSEVAAGRNYLITPDDLRWARRYLETGGGGIGDTTHVDYYPAQVSGSGNLACEVVSSVSQCVGSPCIPAFDLNRDRTNNAADLAILEAYMRGFIPTLPANQLDPRF